MRRRSKTEESGNERAHGFLSIRKTMFFVLFCTVFLLILISDSVMRSMYHDAFSHMLLFSMDEFTNQLSINLSSRVRSLEENLVYLLDDSKVYKYQDDWSQATEFSIERNMKSFATLLNSRDVPVKSIYVLDRIRNEYFHDTVSRSHADFPSFREKQAYRYILDNYDVLRRAKGKTFWRLFPDAPDTIYLIKSTLDLQKIDFRGITCIAIDRSYFQRFFTNKICHILLFDEEGNILYREDGTDVLSRIGTFGEVAFLDAFFVNSKTLDDIDWRLVGLMPMDTAMRSIEPFQRQLNSIEVIILCVALLIVLFLTRSTTRNIVSLSRNFRKIGEGKPVEDIVYHNHDETAYLCRKFNEMHEQLQRSLEEKSRSIRLKNEAEYNALVAKMNPHFLYNTLESINSLARLHHDRDIMQVIQKLSDLLRASIGKGGESILLEDELSYAEEYLCLQKTVSSGKLTWEMHVEEACRDCLVPKFILLFVLENSIIHGFSGLVERPFIGLVARIVDDDLYLEISDNGIGMEQETADRILSAGGDELVYGGRKHMGLKSIRDRLDEFSGSRFAMQVLSVPMEGTVVTMRFPIRKRGTTVCMG